jgi:hypothetical protein
VFLLRTENRGSFKLVGAALVVRPGDRLKYRFRAKEQARVLLAECI